MYLSAEEVARMESLYGKPVEERRMVEMGAREWGILKRSRVRGRAHDVTLFVLQDGKLAAIAKHPYPPGIFRAPSGGVLPGESMEEGIAREMMEETGLRVSLKRYALRVKVEFSRGGETIPWTTHVFEAEALPGEIAPLDLEEIREARWVSLEELSGRIRDSLLASESAGLRYRAWLHDRMMQLLTERG
jgi:8-oxo-dGTP pyrophosphatase MutT (NUDIX family)